MSYQFLYAQGKNLVTYKEYEVLFERGITTIRGPNRSGKSLSLSVMGNILFSTPPVLNQKNKAKVLLTSASSQAMLGFRRGKIVTHIEQFSKGKTVGIRIYKHKAKEMLDRKKHNINIRGDVKAKVRQEFQQNEDLFYNISYITSRQNQLQFGKAADRNRFFQSVFKLDYYDIIKKKLTKRLHELVKDEGTLHYIRSEREKLPVTVDLKDTRQQLKKAQKTYDKYNGRVKEAQRKVTELTAIVALMKQLSQHDKEFTQADAEQAVATCQEFVRTAEAEQKRLLKLQGQAEEQEQNRERRASIQERLEKLKDIKGQIAECEEEISHLQEDEGALEAYHEVLEQNVIHEGKINGLMPLLGKTKLLSKDALAKKMEKVQGIISSTQETIDMMSELEGHKECPTCKHHLDAKMVSKLLKEANSRQSEAVAEMKVFKLMKTIHDLTDKLLDVPKLPKQYRKSPPSMIEFHETLEREQRRLKYLNLKKQLREQLKLIPEPQKIKDVSEDLDKVRKTLKKHREQLEIANRDLKVLKQLAEYPEYANPGEELKHQRNIVDSLGDRVQKANVKVQQLKVDLSSGKQTRERIKVLDAQIADLADRTKEIPVYKALIKLHGTKGMRVDRTREFAELYADRLNQYASMIFGEPFYFSVAVTETRFDINAERSGKVSDISMLSNSETQCFKLLSMLALMSIIPKEMRTNFVVLDEVEANMDKESERLYANRFLPMLKEWIDVIFVVTPKTEEEFFIEHVDHRYQVSKIKGVSRIKKVA